MGLMRLNVMGHLKKKKKKRNITEWLGDTLIAIQDKQLYRQ